MVNPEHVAVARGGKETIEEWRKDHLGETLDLRGADLTGADLSGANFIDGGSDVLGYAFRMTYDRKSGEVNIRAGCRSWDSFEDAFAHYGPGYTGNGDPEEILRKLHHLQAQYDLRVKQSGTTNG